MVPCTTHAQKLGYVLRVDRLLEGGSRNQFSWLLSEVSLLSVTKFTFMRGKM